MTSLSCPPATEIQGCHTQGRSPEEPDAAVAEAVEIDRSEAFAGLNALRRVFLGLAALMGLGVVGMAISTLALGRAQKRADRAQRLGRYHLMGKIGEGGMGQVFLARHAMLRRPTAVKLIQEYGSIESLYEGLDTIKSKALKGKLDEHRDKAFLSRELVVIDTEAPVGAGLDDLAPRDQDTGVLKEKFIELEFSSYISHIEAGVEAADDERHYTLVDSDTACNRLLARSGLTLQCQHLTGNLEIVKQVINGRIDLPTFATTRLTSGLTKMIHCQPVECRAVGAEGVHGGRVYPFAWPEVNRIKGRSST